MSILQTKLRLRYYGEPLLRRRARPLKTVTEQDRAILGEMAEVMRLGGGIGLSAPQVGIEKQMIVVDVGEGLLRLVNPKIIKKSGSDVREEGCLSLPGIYIKVKRSKRIVVVGLNEKNEKVSLSACDILARAIQHEIDHLRGRLIIDYANVFKKIGYKKKLKESSWRKSDGLF